MILKWCVIFIIINVVSCIRSIQKISPKYNTASSNPDPVKLTLPSDKNPFPDVVYPTSIFDIANPFYFNTDNNYEVLGPFSEDVKSSYKLLSSLMKSPLKNSVENVKNQTEINEFVTTPATDAVNIVSIQGNISEDCHNDSQDNFDNAKVMEGLIETQNSTDSILGNIAQSFDFYNISLPEEIQNESCSKISLLIKINIQVFKERPNKSTEEKVIEISNNLRSQYNEDNTKHLKQVTDTSSNQSSEEINSSSEEHYTELQDIKHSDFIKIISDMLLDLLVSTENATSEMFNTTSIENELLEGMVLSVNNSTDLEPFGSKETNVTDIKVNGTQRDFESLSNLTKPLNLTDLTVNVTHNDFQYLLNLSQLLNLTDLIANGTHDDFENLLNSSEPLNLTDLTVYEISNDFKNLLILSDSSNLTDQTVNGTHNDFQNLLNLTGPLNLTDVTVYDFDNILNLTDHQPFRDSDEESSKDSKEDYFLEFLISLDSLCDNNQTEEIVV